jgi:nucleoside-diphosphate-sugar epimerase
MTIKRFTVTRRALVTGAYGFVGASLCKLLVEGDWRLVAAHRRAASPPALAGTEQARLPLSAEPQRWLEALRSIDCVVHLAANVHQMGREATLEANFDAVNVEGSRFVAEQCARAGVKRLVYLSSIKVNGEGSNDHAYRAEDHPDPQDAYARSKLAAEIVVRDVCETAGVECVIIRPPLVYGPGVRANFRSLLKIVELGVPLPFGSINNRRSLVGVKNLVSFIETCMTHPGAAGRVWLISDGDDLSTTGLMRKLSRLMQRPDRLFAFSPRWLRRLGKIAGLGAQMSRLCDSLTVDATPAHDRLGWRPTASVDEGLALTVAAFRAERNQAARR